MARRVRKTYTEAERSALVAEVERLYREGGRSYPSIARELGLGESTYHNWVKRGVKPAGVATATPPVKPWRDEDERARQVARVEQLRLGGMSVRGACRAAEVAEKSFRRWQKALEPGGTALVPVSDARAVVAPPPMRPVEIVVAPLAFSRPVPAPEVLTLVAPGGYRIEGLAVETAAALLRALA